jgi:hypothetical protein
MVCLFFVPHFMRIHTNNIPLIFLLYITKKTLDDIRQQLSKESKLDLSNREINDEDAKVSAKTLETNTTCISVNLRNNSIGDEGAEALVNALKINPMIIEFDIRNNKIGNKGYEALRNLIETNNRYDTFEFDTPGGGSSIYIRADPIITRRFQN